MQVVFIVWLEIHALRDSLSHFPALHQSDPVELNQLGAPDGGKGTGGLERLDLSLLDVSFRATEVRTEVNCASSNSHVDIDEDFSG